MTFWRTTVKVGMERKWRSDAATVNDAVLRVADPPTPEKLLYPPPDSIVPEVQDVYRPVGAVAPLQSVFAHPPGRSSFSTSR